jgi:hypothetical protein
MATPPDVLGSMKVDFASETGYGFHMVTAWASEATAAAYFATLPDLTSPEEEVVDLGSLADDAFATRFALDGFMGYNVHLRHGALLATLLIMAVDEGSDGPLDEMVFEALVRQVAVRLEALPRVVN